MVSESNGYSNGAESSRMTVVTTGVKKTFYK
jgi:hypothetical protein